MECWNIGKREKIAIMIGQKAVWVEKQKRKKQLSNAPGDEETAYFGYQRISAVKKTDRVLQHFNSVAPYYDFMNTCCSTLIPWHPITIL
jgi:hypothetical protein